MFKKGWKINSIIKGSCPKCQKESMYKNSNPYIISETLKMNEKCSHCSTQYKIEPSFFYGAMYVSYPVGIAFAAVAFVISYLLIGTSLNVAFIIIVVTMLILLPIILRLSRNIWINLFMSYDKKLADK